MKARIVNVIIFFCVFLCLRIAAQEEPSSSAEQSALERVEQEREESQARAENGGRRSTVSVPVRRRSTLGTADPIFRNGVPYYDEWTIRAGAQLLRLPAYPGWQGVKPSSEFYQLNANAGEPGYHLASVLTNARYVRETRSRYVNFFSLIWVPQEHAFTVMTSATFDSFAQTLHERLVSERADSVTREAFLDFENYLSFKMGEDESVEEFVDGYLIRSIYESDMVTYFANSEFVFQTRKTEIRQPMIMTITYALVDGKLLRIDIKRLFTSDEDMTRILGFTRQFVDDMRAVNALGGRKFR
ncbi:hypothetical protein [Pelagicoccus sp. SDUM812003]|uniref:hypothetical protein n=1 Tax=Pelagicoccus sp. SDUM812003 TaxID=3041267 RepID=UPI0028109847|nr:hypothetical protein [Pelagicoccus sp. SDUM812003]MDQ8203426.1 hypothetical protein [Pelagicoccus sp. SDUM812003]